MKILLVEDEKYITRPIEQTLKKNNYSIDVVHDGKYGLDCALTGLYDIIILDIMLPRLDGIQILKELRKNGIETPILMLSAKDQISDKIEGLESGADDYLAKPFDMRELSSRLQALGRRRNAPYSDGVLEYEEIQLNPHTLVLASKGKEIKLTLKEAQLLELLIHRKNTAVSKDVMIEKVWGYDSDAADQNVEYHISLLRKKMTRVGIQSTIRTIRSVGYILGMKD